ncbi:MAG: hypothetical protein E6914_04845 [Veillonella sp.]|nr:hypothetical protein [Veillonella sp.]
MNISLIIVFFVIPVILLTSALSCFFSNSILSFVKSEYRGLKLILCTIISLLVYYYISFNLLFVIFNGISAFFSQEVYIPDVDLLKSFAAILMISLVISLLLWGVASLIAPDRMISIFKSRKRLKVCIIVGIGIAILVLFTILLRSL